MKTLRLTKAELEAIEYAVGQLAGGDAGDCGGDDREGRARLKAMRSVHLKIIEAERGRKDYQEP